MKRKRSKSPVKKLQEKAERIWKEICIARDGRECQVKKHFPEIGGHTDIIQVDHYITRSNKWFFLEPQNGTVVCSGCNSRKAWGQKSIAWAIEQIVIKREGEKAVEDMNLLNMAMKPNENFSKIWWLEAQIRMLEMKRREYR